MPLLCRGPNLSSAENRAPNEPKQSREAAHSGTCRQVHLAEDERGGGFHGNTKFCHNNFITRENTWRDALVKGTRRWGCVVAMSTFTQNFSTLKARE